MSLVKSEVLVGLLVGSLLFAPFAGAQPTPNAGSEDVTSIVSFYGHIFGIGRTLPMPMNTQFPYGEADLSQGFTANTCGLPTHLPYRLVSILCPMWNAEWPISVEPMPS